MAHPELDALFHTLLTFAQTMLREYGEFYPFGAVMTSAGKIRQVGAKMEGDDHPPSQPLIDLLTETFKKQAKKGDFVPLESATNFLKRVARWKIGHACPGHTLGLGDAFVAALAEEHACPLITKDHGHFDAVAAAQIIQITWCP